MTNDRDDASLIDQPAGLREEDAFDAAAVGEWLADRVEGVTGVPVVRQFAGGASNLTYLLSYPERDLILRRPPGGHRAASAHDMDREYRVQKAIKPSFPYVPEMLAFCDDASLIGTEFYVMERLEGIILRRDLPEAVPSSPDRVRALCTDVLDRLVELHQIDVRAAGLSDLGRGAGYVRRQISGWSDRFRRAHTSNVPDFEDVMTWLSSHAPDDVATCLIHNDFRFDNIVFDNAGTMNVIGILDWEMATLGDPLMELGATLAYWVQSDDDDVMQQSRRQPTHLPGMLTRAEVVDYYAQKTGRSVTNWKFYEVYGLFRLAVIIQQLYRRFHDGGTHNPLYKDFWIFTGYLEWRCKEAIKEV
ncbi:phosphotransferase family protein [Hoyosella subflava]|uniref:Aminoglycoside phosphotransferase n=1 Tax=Hoyosella subflava (strain DSM 45089 / JCM 17490 / NBRC 109087 / DQS3-9A1) TaxID=443218 RepID=F6EG17_HOYSD|nr:phosphotransferase family protein [Hoyosella subflava]AEF38719.1 Aminoglycoside phosphotransferase [Hoyosella subflava DQS3-9A1]